MERRSLQNRFIRQTDCSDRFFPQEPLTAGVLLSTEGK